MTDEIINLRVRTNKGVKNLPPISIHSTLKDLKQVICNIIEKPEGSYNIIHPKDDLNNSLKSSHDMQTLSELAFKNRETLTISDRPSQTLNISNCPNHDIIQVPQIHKSRPGILLRKTVPADDSCLFTSIHYCLKDGILDTSPDTINKYRKIISDAVLTFDPRKSHALQQPFDTDDFEYLQNLINPASLGKPNHQYASWILAPKSWGGAVEIAIFSRYFRIEIDVVDIRSQRIEKFGQEKGYPQRILLLYDGIHYDPLALEIEITPGEYEVQTRFSITYDDILDEAKEIANEIYKNNQFSSSDRRVYCLDCGTYLNGEKEVIMHARTFQHGNYRETN